MLDMEGVDPEEVELIVVAVLMVVVTEIFSGRISLVTVVMVISSRTVTFQVEKLMMEGQALG